MNLADTLRARTGLDLRDVAGARVSGELPVTNDAVNRLLADRIRNHPQIASIRVEARPDDAAAVEIVPRMRLVPLIRVLARIERQPDFPRDPALMLRWSMPAAGPLALFAGPALSFLRKTPPGVRIEGDRATVDLAEVLRARGQDEVLPLLRRVAVHTRPGGFVLHVELEVGSRD